MSDWVGALDRYEEALDRHEAVLGDAGEVVAGAVWQPPQLPAGGVPSQHRARAEALLARTVELARKAALAHQNLPPLPTSRPQPRSNRYGNDTPSRYVDQAM